MYKTLHVENFKALKHLDLELDRLTVLIGPNGCGKTSVLQAMEIFGEIATTTPNDVLLDRRSIDVLHSRDASEPIALEGRGTGWSVRWTAGAMPHGSATIKWAEGDSAPEAIESTRPLTEKLPASLSSQIPRAKLLHLEHRKLSDVAAAASREPELLADGSNLATVLAFLRSYDEPAAKRIIEAVRAVVPAVRDVRVRPADVPRPVRPRDRFAPPEFEEREPLPGHEIVFDTETGNDIPAHAASEGTLRVLALLTEILGRRPPALLLLDDLDRGVHPRAMSDLVRGIRTAIARSPGLHVVVTTHSPYLLEQFDPAREIRLMWLAGGGARCMSMAEHPRFEEWRELMSPAELWSAMDRTLPSGNAGP